MFPLSPEPRSLEMLRQNRSSIVYVINITGYCLAFFAVGLRFMTRKLTKARLWWDDYLVAVSLVSMDLTRVARV